MIGKINLANSVILNEIMVLSTNHRMKDSRG